MCWREDFIDLCYCCTSDPATQSNMRNLVIPRLEEEAQRHRECLAQRPPGDVNEGWQFIESELKRLERALASARIRCKTQPVQQELFAA